MGARFLRQLPGFLRHPVTIEEAKATLVRRIENRERDFLSLTRQKIYGNPSSIYSKLLRHAGCDYADVEQLVFKDGLESALTTLFRNGVFLTVEEFKGRSPIERGSTTFQLEAGQLMNPASKIHLYVHTSGSGGAETFVPVDLSYVRDRSVNAALVNHARGAADWQHAIWAVPGGAAMTRLLRLCGSGIIPARWFSQLALRQTDLHPRYYWSARALCWGGYLAGVRLPFPEHVPIDQPVKVAGWMQGVLRSGSVPNLWLSASSAVRLSLAALESGVDLHGGQFTLGGDPLTAARAGVIGRTGANALSTYGTMECGRVGEGCLAAENLDELHLLHDLHAVIQPAEEATKFNLPPSLLFVSSIRQTDPLIRLNISLGDEAVISQRKCGCPLEQLGWKTHLHGIRSLEKLTAAGMTFLDLDVIRVLDDSLPAAFGGAPTDYQLTEEEDENGNARLVLLVDPSLGPLAEDAVRQVFLNAVSQGAGASRVMGALWREAQLLRVERRPPIATSSGKILHVHLDRKN